MVNQKSKEIKKGPKDPNKPAKDKKDKKKKLLVVQTKFNNSSNATPVTKQQDSLLFKSNEDRTKSASQQHSQNSTPEDESNNDQKQRKQNETMNADELLDQIKINDTLDEKGDFDPDSDFEITPNSQIFEALSSENNSQETLITNPKKFDKAPRKNEDFECKVFENGLFVVFDVSREPLGTVLILKSVDDDNVPLNFRITLRGTWIRTPVDHGDYVRVIGQFKQSNHFTLTLDDEDSDLETGAAYLILEPNILISSTSIVTSFPCVRTSIFSDQFRTNLGDFEYPLVIGNIIHEAFERIIQAQNFDEDYLNYVFRESMKNHYCHLYQLKRINEDRVLRDLRTAAQNIQLWVQNMLEPDKNSYGIIFERAIASEQEFNSYIYGIKGKVDTTVIVKNAHSPDFERVTALELKTGKEQVNHKGQVLLYSLLLTERFINHNNQNLLLYIMNKGKSYYVNTVRNELCLLIQRRNELAKLQKISGEGKQYQLPPILDQDICHKCYVNKVCSYYQMAVEEEKLEQEPQFQTYQDVKKVADPVSRNYFKKWYNIIQLEQSTANVTINLNLNSSDLKKVKDENLKITKLESIDESNGEFYVYLERPYYNGSKVNSDITENMYVNLHTIKSISFTKALVVKKHLLIRNNPNQEDEDDNEEEGFDGEIEKAAKRRQKEKIHLEYILLFQQTNIRNFEAEALGGVQYLQTEWYIEMEAFQTFQFNIMRHNLQNLCIAPENQKFRELIIKQRQPVYPSDEDISTFEDMNKDILEDLNEEQVRAICRSYLCDDYQMIIGVPGSGKHEVIARFMLIAKRMKRKIIMMGYNNNSIDNLLIRLMELQERFKDIEKSTFIRVSNNNAQINKKIQPFVKTCSRFDSFSNLDETIKNTDIFCATTMSVFNTFFGCTKFDYCILDEASLITEPLSLGPIMMAHKFIMVGDYYILNPIVKNIDAEKQGMSISLFRKLSERYPYDVVILKKQYRMNDHICSLSNVIAYKGLIKFGGQDVQESTLIFNESQEMANGIQHPFLKEIKLPERKVVFINTDQLLNKALNKQLNSMRNRNFYEGAIIHAIVENFINSGISRKQIGIITPFADQQALLQKQLLQFKMKVHLLEKIQGIEKDVLIVSCVQHNRKQAISKDIKRLYLTFPRAKKKLLVVGSMTNLAKVQPMDQFVGYIQKKRWYLDINNALQIKKHFAPEAGKYLSFLAPNKGDALQGQRHPNTCAYLGNNKRFAEENKIVYHIDGVATTHTGMPKAKLNTLNFSNII